MRDNCYFFVFFSILQKHLFYIPNSLPEFRVSFIDNFLFHQLHQLLSFLGFFSNIIFFKVFFHLFSSFLTDVMNVKVFPQSLNFTKIVLREHFPFQTCLLYPVAGKSTNLCEDGLHYNRHFWLFSKHQLACLQCSDFWRNQNQVNSNFLHCFLCF